ncbi:MAG: oxidoreductase [Rhodospirillaceae bacterium]|nr:oxidoreductase [Rhodospirillaceae bacterium]|tara:strand:- start:669 stop:1370 length:702 start_codon:yes stop_codon:yes gene_type:complete
MADKELALIVGVGEGLSASLARLCAEQGMNVALAARKPGKLGDLCAETGAKAYTCDVSDSASVDALFDAVTAGQGVPNLVVYNPSARVRGPIIDLDREAAKDAVLITAHGGFVVAQKAAQLMVKRGSGAIFFTGASASVKGFSNSSVFAMGKFGLRGLAQALARELHPQNIHIGHFVIDGGIIKKSGDDRAAARGEDGMLDPDSIAETYMHMYRQHRSAWAWEIEVRPWVEKF